MYDQIVTAIGSVGFPIVAACAMFYLCYTTIDKMTNAINDLTMVMELVKDRLDIKTEGKKDEN